MINLVFGIIRYVNKAFIFVLGIVVLVGASVIGGILYYRMDFASKMQSQFTTGQSAPFVDLKINKSDGPLSVSLGSQLDIAWTSGGMSMCSSTGWWSSWPPLNPFPNSGSSTQTWQGGGRGTNSDHYQITCTTSEGQVVSDAVAIDSLPFAVSIDVNPEVAAPIHIQPGVQNYLLGSFVVQTGMSGIFLTGIGVLPNQKILSGSLAVAPNSIRGQVLSPGVGNVVWFEDPKFYGPPFDHSGGPDDIYPGLSGFVWLPPDSTTTINIFGDIGNARPGKYTDPFTITIQGGANGDPIQGPGIDQWGVASSNPSQNIEVDN